MRILYLHQYFALLQSPTGTRSYEFARRLIAAGHDVHILTSSAMLPEAYQHGEDIEDVVIDDIPVRVICVPYSNEMSFAERIRAFIGFAFRASIEATQMKTDLIFATSTPLTIGIPAMIGQLWQRVPMVFEVRDLWPELPIAIGVLKNPFLIWLASALEWIIYHMATHVVALSPGMAAGVQRRGIAPERITVIPNSCDVDIFDVPSSEGDEVRAQLGLQDGQPLVVYTGTFGMINGVSYLIDLAAEMCAIDPQMRFLLVGKGAMYEDVITRAQELGVLDKTLFVWNPVPKQEIPGILAAATVATSLFLPIEAMWNNSANKFFDALAAGKPIAINYRGWQAELLEGTGAGIVLDSIDKHAAAQALADFANDQARLQAAHSAAHQLAYDRFQRDLMAEKLLAVFEQTYLAKHKDDSRS